MIFILFLFLFLVLLSYVYYSFLLFLLSLEVILVGVFCMSIFLSMLNYLTFISVMALVCYVVMEAVLGLSLLMFSYRFYGVSYFSQW